MLDPDLQDEADVQKAIERYGAAPQIGGAIGTGAGAIIGGLIGSFVPVPGVGTVAGATAGAAVGGALGSLGGTAVQYAGQDAEGKKLAEMQRARLGPEIEKQARLKAFQQLLADRSSFR